MTVTVDIPDILATSLGSAIGDVRRAVIEGLAVDAYRSGKFSFADVRELLGHSSRWETEDFLSQHNAWPDPSEAEVEADMCNLFALRGS